MDKNYAKKMAKKTKGQLWYSEKCEWMHSDVIGDTLIVHHGEGSSDHHDLEGFVRMYAIAVLKEDFSDSQKVWRWWYYTTGIFAVLDFSTPLVDVDEKLSELGI